MRLDVAHFRTKLGRKIVFLFVMCALLPTVALSIFSYLRVRSELRAQSTELMDLATGDAQMGTLERLQSLESELMLLAASPSVSRALSGTSDSTGRTEPLRRLGALSVTIADATIPIVGDLTVTPELPDTIRANLDRGQSALVVVQDARSQPEILIAHASGGARVESL